MRIQACANFDAVVHLTGVTTRELVRKLADAAGVAMPPSEVSDPGQDMETLLASLRERPFTVLVDALDEAQEPATIASTVLRRLAALPRARVIVGTRASTREGPDQPHTTNQDLLDALGRANTTTVFVERDKMAITAYVRLRLAAASEAMQRHLGDAVIDQIAALVGDREREFLFARLAVHEMIARPDLLAPEGFEELGELLSGDHRTLFAAAVTRLTSGSRTAKPLLEALALARGRGVPRADRIWAVMAAAIADNAEIHESDIDDLLAAAAPYIMLDAQDGQSVYRLAHRTFQEFFLRPWLAGSSGSGVLAGHHKRIAGAFLASARDAGAANPYVTYRLAEHVAEAGMWDELAEAPFVLDDLDPDSVAAETLRTVYGRADLPPAIAASLSARHLLSVIRPGDRAMTRAIAMACLQPGYGSPTGGGYPRAWARLRRHDPLHVTLAGHAAAVRAAMALPLPDGRVLLATGGDDGALRLWDPSTGRPVGDPLVGAAAAVLGLTILDSGEGRTLVVSAGSDGFLRLWDPDSGQPYGEPLAGHTAAVLSVAAFPGPKPGRALITSGLDRKILSWEIAVGRPVSSAVLVAGYRARAVAVLSSPAGRGLLITGGFDGSVCAWDPGTGELVAGPLSGPAGAIRALAALTLPDGRSLVAAGGDEGTFSVWQPQPGELVAGPLSGPTGAVHALAALTLPDGRSLVAAGGDDATVRLWDPLTGQPVGDPLTGHQRPVHAIATVALPDGRTLLASGSEDGSVRLWDPSPAREPRRQVPRRSGRILALAALPRPGGHPLIATGDDAGAVQLIDPFTGAPLGEAMLGDTGAIHALAAVPLSGGGALLVSGGADGSLTRWDPGRGVRTGEPLTGHTGTVTVLATVATSAGGVRLASAGNDDKIWLWDPVSGRPAGRLAGGHRWAVHALAAVRLGGNSVLLASAGEDPAIPLWDPMGCVQAASFSAAGATSFHALAVGSTAPGETWLAAGDHGGLVIVWDVSSQAQVAVLGPVGGPVLSMAAVPGPGGRDVLAVTSGDRAVRLWDPRAALLVRTILLPSGQCAERLIAVETRIVMCTDIGVISCELDATLSE
jgi:WD40 repeat protein